MEEYVAVNASMRVFCSKGYFDLVFPIIFKSFEKQLNCFLDFVISLQFATQLHKMGT